MKKLTMEDITQNRPTSGSVSVSELVGQARATTVTYATERIHLPPQLTRLLRNEYRKHGYSAFLRAFERINNKQPSFVVSDGLSYIYDDITRNWKVDVDNIELELFLVSVGMNDLHGLGGRIRTLQRLMPNLTTNKRTDYIYFKNGKYNKHTRALEPYKRKDMIVKTLSVAYQPNLVATNSLIPYIENATTNTELLKQVIYDTLDFGTHRRRCTLLYDTLGKSGKSTLLSLLSNVVGHDRTAHMNLSDFNFSGAEYMQELQGASLIIGDENSEDWIKSSKAFKSVVGGEAVATKRMYQSAVIVKYNGAILQATNSMPRFKDRSKAILDRFNFLEFKQPTERNALLKDIWIHAQDSLNELATYIVDTVQDFDQNDWNDAVQDVKQVFIEDNKTSVQQFWDDYINVIDNGTTMKAIYYCYENYCKLNKFKAVGTKKFNASCDTKRTTTQAPHNQQERFLQRMQDDGLINELSDNWISKDKLKQTGNVLRLWTEYTAPTLDINTKDGLTVNTRHDPNELPID